MVNMADFNVDKGQKEIYFGNINGTSIIKWLRSQ